MCLSSIWLWMPLRHSGLLSNRKAWYEFAKQEFDIRRGGAAHARNSAELEHDPERSVQETVATGSIEESGHVRGVYRQHRHDAFVAASAVRPRRCTVRLHP